MAEKDNKMSSRNDRVHQQEGNTSMNEEELASKTLYIQSKRIYLDVKQNRRGRFLKIAEISTGGRKNRIVMSMNVASALRDQLQTFDDYLRTLGDQPMNDSDERHSAVISRDDRKYYIDLRENERGRFLRIAMVGINSPRTQIVLPAQGIQELKESLTSLVEEYGNEEDRDSIESLPAIEPSELPKSKFLHVGNKDFYFDTGSNNRGIFLRISEVRPNSRTSITIPEKVWPYFRDNINDFILTMNNERVHTSSIIDNSPKNPDEKSSIPPSGQ